MDKQEIKRKNKPRIIIKETLNCQDFGIYAAECKMCNEFYVGQTKTKFNIRWNTHRNGWKKAGQLRRIGQDISDENDD